MLVKLLTGLAGLHASYSPGEIVEMDDAEALRHIAKGAAVEAGAVSKPRKVGGVSPKPKAPEAAPKEQQNDPPADATDGVSADPKPKATRPTRKPKAS